MKWYIGYWSRNTYKRKIVLAADATQAIKRAKVKNIDTVKICTSDETLARNNPESYTYIESL